MIDPSNNPRPAPPGRGFPIFSMIVLITAIFACSIYANYSYTMKDQKDLQYLPPFKAYEDHNWNKHLGAEYIHIAKAIHAGKGFSNPFTNLESGPTAWMPPLLPYLLASLLWLCNGDTDLVMAVVIFLQVYTLVFTGILVLFLARQNTSRVWTGVIVVLFVLGVICDFHQWFQFIHDSWFVLLFLDLLIAGVCWLRPLQRWPTAAGWGLFGGLCALVNPIIAFTWGMLSLMQGIHQRRWRQFGVALAAAALMLLPWTVRNLVVFGRLIPVKPNLAYELYQSQCLQKDGLLENSTFTHYHPNSPGTRERQEYKALGEMAYLDRKTEQFKIAFWEDPQNFVKRVWDRFLGATLWFDFVHREAKKDRPTVLLLSRLTHPLPFVSLLVLIVMAVWKRLHWAEWVAIAVYVLYLFPYIGISYYERYAAPLVGIKVLLVVFAVDRLLSLLPRWRRPFALRSLTWVTQREPNRAIPVSS